MTAVLPRRFDLRYHAARNPTKAAIVMGKSGRVVSYAELDERSSRLASYLERRGLGRGDHMAVMMDNNPRYLEVCWAALRSGLHFTPVNWHLTADEAGYIVTDSGSLALVVSPAVADVARRLAAMPDGPPVRLAIEPIDGFDDYETALATSSPDRPESEPEGQAMFYTSGTTGRPKGVLRPLSEEPLGVTNPLAFLAERYHFDSETVYLCPAPLYHSAPNYWSLMVQRLGGTVVVMESFDPLSALELIETHQVTHAQFVPTMFVRMLKLPEAERNRFNLSSLRCAVHAAAPCPVEIKRQMLEWWGPIIYEYWGSTEGGGFAAIGPEEWLAHPGSVGQPSSQPVHIFGEDGTEVASGEVGVIYVEGAAIEYHNDPGKTDAAHNESGWATVGDMGYIDADGYLYLTDRKDHMIISGGVNIYPQEIEDVLLAHPKVLDAGVIGVPDDEFGEQVKAVVQLVDPTEEGPAMAQELLDWCRSRLAHFKCPRTIDFTLELPRSPTGKLLKRVMRAPYWAKL
jgi:long-chain acyl-CoA synthetase